MKQIAATYY